MAHLSEESEIYDLYAEAKKESKQWREDYHEFERLADNDLLPDLDENLPETNDGSLAAGLFKLPKRIINSKLTGRAKALDRDDAWLTELANIQWENEIIPNANSQAQYRIESGKNIIEAIKDFDGSPRATVTLTHEIMHPTVVSINDGAKEGNEVGTKHTKTIVDE